MKASGVFPLGFELLLERYRATADERLEALDQHASAEVHRVPGAVLEHHVPAEERALVIDRLDRHLAKVILYVGEAIQQLVVECVGCIVMHDSFVGLWPPTRPEIYVAHRAEAITLIAAFFDDRHLLYWHPTGCVFLIGDAFPDLLLRCGDLDADDDMVPTVLAIVDHFEVRMGKVGHQRVRILSGFNDQLVPSQSRQPVSFNKS